MTVAARPSIPPGPNQPCWCGSGEKYKKCHRSADGAALLAMEEERRKGAVRPGALSPPRAVPAHIPRPDYAATGRPGPGVPHDPDPAARLARMRRACKAAAEVLHELGAAVRPGITTDALDALGHEAMIRRGAYPSTLNYHGYPKSLCTSVNEVICHGIPDDRVLEEGDLVNLDVTLYLDGMHGDCSATFPVGRVDAESERVIAAARECLDVGIAAVKPGRPVSDIGAAIEAHARKLRVTVFRDYCGHGIGETFHTELQIPHAWDPRARTIMREGMFFTVEPMINLGTGRHVLWPDGWTVVTADGLRSAQFEHTLHVTPAGAEILTLP